MNRILFAQFFHEFYLINSFLHSRNESAGEAEMLWLVNHEAFLTDTYAAEAVATACYNYVLGIHTDFTDIIKELNGC